MAGVWWESIPPALPWVKGRALEAGSYLCSTLNIIESIPQLPALFCLRDLSFDLIFP